MAKIKKITISKKMQRAARRGNYQIDQRGRLQKDLPGEPREKEESSNKTTAKEKITIPQVVPIRKLAEQMGKTPSEVVAKLFQNGVQATINESVDFDTAAIIADEFDFIATKQDIADISTKTDTVKSWVIDQNWEGNVIPGQDQEETVVLFDIPRDAPTTSIKITLRDTNHDTGITNSHFSYIDIQSVGALTTAMC